MTPAKRDNLRALAKAITVEIDRLHGSASELSSVLEDETSTASQVRCAAITTYAESLAKAIDAFWAREAKP